MNEVCVVTYPELGWDSIILVSPTEEIARKYYADQEIEVDDYIFTTRGIETNE